LRFVRNSILLYSKIQESKALVSVVIPAYNADAYIQETLDSILAQTYADFEIILINDGSTDNTEGVIQSYADSRIQYFFQKNQGVSAARNAGFLKTKGEYIVFFDADDKMSVDFLEARVEALKSDTTIDFCCGTLVFFPNYKEQLGACEDIPMEILLYQQNIETCPSNYLFRRNILEKISFNGQLSSTADRFFLLQVAQIAKGKRVESGILQYRFMPDSMSGQLTKKMVDDNEMFYSLLVEQNLIPLNIKQKALKKGYYVLGASYWKMGYCLKSIRYLFKYVAANIFAT
jgi:teichuronic acid biosynthesis glycosyltransferase TuaG